MRSREINQGSEPPASVPQPQNDQPVRQMPSGVLIQQRHVPGQSSRSEFIVDVMESMSTATAPMERMISYIPTYHQHYDRSTISRHAANGGPRLTVARTSGTRAVDDSFLEPPAAVSTTLSYTNRVAGVQTPADATTGLSGTNRELATVAAASSSVVSNSITSNNYLTTNRPGSGVSPTAISEKLKALRVNQKTISRIDHSSKFRDSVFEYRFVVLPRNHPFLDIDPEDEIREAIFCEAEWRALGIRQTKGWEHFGFSKHESNILLFRRPIQTDPHTGLVPPEIQAAVAQRRKELSRAQAQLEYYRQFPYEYLSQLDDDENDEAQENFEGDVDDNGNEAEVDDGCLGASNASSGQTCRLQFPNRQLGVEDHIIRPSLCDVEMNCTGQELLPTGINQVTSDTSFREDSNDHSGAVNDGANEVLQTDSRTSEVVCNPEQMAVREYTYSFSPNGAAATAVGSSNMPHWQNNGFTNQRGVARFSNPRCASRSSVSLNMNSTLLPPITIQSVPVFGSSYLSGSIDPSSPAVAVTAVQRTNSSFGAGGPTATVKLATVVTARFLSVAVRAIGSDRVPPQSTTAYFDFPPPVDQQLPVNAVSAGGNMPLEVEETSNTQHARRLKRRLHRPLTRQEFLKETDLIMSSLYFPLLLT